jgi:hypothetical protein
MTGTHFRERVSLLASTGETWGKKDFEIKHVSVVVIVGNKYK